MKRKPHSYPKEKAVFKSKVSLIFNLINNKINKKKYKFVTNGLGIHHYKN